MENNMTLNEYQDLAARTINKDLPAAATLAHSLHEIAAKYLKKLENGRRFRAGGFQATER